MGNWYADDYTGRLAQCRRKFFFDDTAVPWDIAYNPKDGFVYGIFNEGSKISTLTLPQCRQLRSQPYIPVFPVVAIAVSKDGVVYWIDSRGTCSFWNTQYGFGFAQTAVDTGINVASEPQSAAFDEDTGLLYWTAKADDGATALYCIDVAGKSCQKLVDFPNNEYVVSPVLSTMLSCQAHLCASLILRRSLSVESLRGIYRLPFPKKTVVGDFPQWECRVYGFGQWQRAF